MADKKRMRLYVDESGDHSFRTIAGAEWRKRYLCLLGCVFLSTYYDEQFCGALTGFKTEHFGRHPDERIILHREDIVHKRPPFDSLRDTKKQEAFDSGLLRLIKETEFVVIAVVIDKYIAQRKYYSSLPFDPYHVALLAMLERYCGLLRFRNAVGDVLAESRGGNEDLQLKAAFQTVHTVGTRYHSPKLFQDTLTSKELKIKPKAHDIAGLQLADMLAHPVKHSILTEHGVAPEPFGFAASVAEVVSIKYNRRYANNQIRGYGKIVL